MKCAICLLRGLPPRDAVYVLHGESDQAEYNTAAWADLDVVLTDERDTLKALRETLCQAESALRATWNDEIDLLRIGRLIAEIDRQRPLGPDGKYGDLHTPSCGCEDR